MVLGKLSKISKDGEAIKVIEPQADHTFKMNSSALKAVLLSEEYKNRKVVVISITGAFRTGKSFLMNFLLTFLKEKDGKRRSSTITDEADFDREWTEVRKNSLTV